MLKIQLIGTNATVARSLSTSANMIIPTHSTREHRLFIATGDDTCKNKKPT